MTRAEEIKEYCVRLNLCYIQQKLNSMIIKAQEEKPTYMDFLANSLRMEAVAYKRTKSEDVQNTSQT